MKTMAYEFVDRARTALRNGDVEAAAAEYALDPAAVRAMPAEEVREWARAEQDQGYGLKAEILERLIEAR
jgi:hypothetical protein